MSENNKLRSKPEGRFNRWGERKAITDENNIKEIVSQELSSLNCDYRGKSLYWEARLTGSTGLEFVFISNSQFEGKENPEKQIHIVPCFKPLDPLNPQTEDRQAAMMKGGQFIYDGWAANVELNSDGINKVVSDLDTLVSLFSVASNYFAYWEPKYFYQTKPVPSHIATQNDFDIISYSIFLLDQLPSVDVKKINKSLAWFSSALIVGPIQKFLFLFLSFESLATYIDKNKYSKESVLQNKFRQKETEEEQLEKLNKQEECINEILKGEDSISEKISLANEGCIYQSIRFRLEKHLDQVFKNKEASKSIFVERSNGKTLWDLRNSIAHGRLNLLSETDNLIINRSVNKLETIIRSYFRTIFSSLAKTKYFLPPKRPILTVPLSQAVVGPDTIFTCTDMAEYYSNAASFTNSFMRIKF